MALVAALSTVTVLSIGASAVPTSARVGADVPAAAMSTHVGITAKTVTVGNIATHFETLFTGAAVGTEAYADYVNSKGGVHGRRIVVTAQNTGFSGTTNKALTQAATAKDFALVGGFSVTDTAAVQVLSKNPSVPDVQMTLSPANNRLPNLVNPSPLGGGWRRARSSTSSTRTPPVPRTRPPWWRTSPPPSTPGRARRRR